MRRPNYSAAFMNNTKWRELLSLIRRIGIQFEVAYVGEERFQTAYAPPESLLKNTYIADPGLAGGPTEYSDIYSIRIPKISLIQNPKTGERLPSTGVSDQFLAEASLLGVLPLEEKDGFIYVHGYSHRVH
ncbi:MULTISPECIES: hypothetical protein [Pseudomonas]|nr:hypothetical protein [Pseudomonas sp. PSE14]WEJ70030.1 hypothetical protein O6P39_15235 [Pseudomonas sp. PSE14]